MLTKLNVDCREQIFSYLGYLELLNYRSTSKDNYANIKLDFREFFIKKLLQLRVIPDKQSALQFCNKLKETGACVAGSFILDILYGTSFSNDIDIYDKSLKDERRQDYRMSDWFNGFEDNSKLQFTKYLYQGGFESISAQLGPDVIIRPYVHKSLAPEIKDRFGIKDDKPLWKVLNLQQSKEIKHYIQIIPIFMEKGDISQFIKATFDLEICQNYFDGERVYLKNLDKLIKKTDYIKCNTKFFFSIYQDAKDISEETTTKRIEKYRSRGFDIQYHPQYDQMKQEINEIVGNYEYGRKFDIWKHIATGEIDLTKYDL